MEPDSVTKWKAEQEARIVEAEKAAEAADSAVSPSYLWNECLLIATPTPCLQYRHNAMLESNFILL